MVDLTGVAFRINGKWLALTHNPGEPATYNPWKDKPDQSCMFSMNLDGMTYGWQIQDCEGYWMLAGSNWMTRSLDNPGIFFFMPGELTQGATVNICSSDQRYWSIDFVNTLQLTSGLENSSFEYWNTAYGALPSS